MSNPFKVGDIVIRIGGLQSEIQTGTRCKVLRADAYSIWVEVVDAHADSVSDLWAYEASNFALAPQTPQKDEAL